MAEHAADRLLENVARLAAPVCVGLDPVAERLPRGVPARRGADPIARIGAFTTAVLDAVADHVPCVKLQSACFERYGAAGVAALDEAVRAARARGLVVILDAKRGDIGVSAEHYAAAAFGASGTGDHGRPDPAAGTGADWLTVNSYFGADGLRPFLRPRRGAFALVRTSNPGGDAIQGRRLEDGRTVAEAVGALVAEVGRDSVGSSGYSALGAVVGATRPEDAARLRAIMPQQIFLVPGYGAQGAGAEDVRAAFAADGRGAIVTASRSVIYAGGPDAAGWPAPVTEAARRLADDIGHAVGLR